MSLVGTIRELAVALNEIKSLREQIGNLKSAFDDVRQRISVLEQDKSLRDIEFQHLSERTRIAAEAGVSVGVARMEGDIKAKIVELDLRLKTVERHGGQDHPPLQLAGP